MTKTFVAMGVIFSALVIIAGLITLLFPAIAPTLGFAYKASFDLVPNGQIPDISYLGLIVFIGGIIFLMIFSYFSLKVGTFEQSRKDYPTLLYRP